MAITQYGRNVKIYNSLGNISQNKNQHKQKPSWLSSSISCKLWVLADNLYRVHYNINNLLHLLYLMCVCLCVCTRGHAFAHVPWCAWRVRRQLERVWFLLSPCICVPGILSGVRFGGQSHYSISDIVANTHSTLFLEYELLPDISRDE